MTCVLHPHLHVGCGGAGEAEAGRRVLARAARRARAAGRRSARVLGRRPQAAPRAAAQPSPRDRGTLQSARPPTCGGAKRWVATAAPGIPSSQAEQAEQAVAANLWGCQRRRRCRRAPGRPPPRPAAGPRPPAGGGTVPQGRGWRRRGARRSRRARALAAGHRDPPLPAVRLWQPNARPPSPSGSRPSASGTQAAPGIQVAKPEQCSALPLHDDVGGTQPLQAAAPPRPPPRPFESGAGTGISCWNRMERTCTTTSAGSSPSSSTQKETTTA